MERTRCCFVRLTHSIAQIRQMLQLIDFMCQPREQMGKSPCHATIRRKSRGNASLPCATSKKKRQQKCLHKLIHSNFGDFTDLFYILNMPHSCSLHVGKFLKGKLRQRKKNYIYKTTILWFFPQIGTETFLVPQRAAWMTLTTNSNTGLHHKRCCLTREAELNSFI